MNAVQFQAGLSMAQFLAQYGTEAKRRRALYRARWPQGFRCPACGDRRRCTFQREGQTYYQCPCLPAPDHGCSPARCSRRRSCRSRRGSWRCTC